MKIPALLVLLAAAVPAAAINPPTALHDRAVARRQAASTFGFMLFQQMQDDPAFSAAMSSVLTCWDAGAGGPMTMTTSAAELRIECAATTGKRVPAGVVLTAAELAAHDQRHGRNFTLSPVGLRYGTGVAVADLPSPNVVTVTRDDLAAALIAVRDLILDESRSNCP